VTILAGGKLSGDYDGFGIGALSVHTNRTPTTAAQNLSVLRITEPVLAESKVGIILTNGDPTGLSRNTLAGADFQYHNSHFGGGNAIFNQTSITNAVRRARPATMMRSAGRQLSE
jgi:hypothetical protein